MDFSLTDEQQMFRDMFRGFATKEVAKIANKSAVATAAALSAIRCGLDAALLDGLAAERAQFTAVTASADAAEGISAFLEKREAKFQDK